MAEESGSKTRKAKAKALDSVVYVVGTATVILYVLLVLQLRRYFGVLGPAETYQLRGIPSWRTAFVLVAVSFYVCSIIWVVARLIRVHIWIYAPTDGNEKRVNPHLRFGARILGAAVIVVWLLVQVPMFLAALGPESWEEYLLNEGILYRNPGNILVICVVAALVARILVDLFCWWRRRRWERAHVAKQRERIHYWLAVAAEERAASQHPTDAGNSDSSPVSPETEIVARPTWRSYARSFAPFAILTGLGAYAIAGEQTRWDAVVITMLLCLLIGVFYFGLRNYRVRLRGSTLTIATLLSEHIIEPNQVRWVQPIGKDKLKVTYEDGARIRHAQLLLDVFRTPEGQKLQLALLEFWPGSPIR